MRQHVGKIPTSTWACDTPGKTGDFLRDFCSILKDQESLIEFLFGFREFFLKIDSFIFMLSESFCNFADCF